MSEETAMSWSLVFRSVVDGPTLADWDWQRPVVLPLVLQGLARSLGGPAAAGELAAGRALLRRYFEWAPGVDRFAPVQVETRFEVNLPDPAGGDRELVLADGRPIRYQGRVDLLAGDEHDRYWVVAHRLVDRFGAADDLLLDEELVAACWTMERFNPGMRIAGTVHNEVRRRADLPVGMDQPPPKAAPRRSRRRTRRHAGASPSTRPAAAAGPCPMPAAVPPGPAHPTRCR
jgi:hypothetical protein